MLHMTVLTKILLVYLLIANVIAFLMMAVDKWKAKKEKWRIPEKFLFLSAMLGGSIGAIAGMCVCRHKTKHLHFMIGMPVILALQIALALFISFKF